jgi:hypothetical protein
MQVPRDSLAEVPEAETPLIWYADMLIEEKWLCHDRPEGLLFQRDHPMHAQGGQGVNIPLQSVKLMLV